MSTPSASSGSVDKCAGKNCRGTIVFAPQVQDFISGPNPDIVKAASMLVQCGKCKNLASTPKEKIVTVLALHGVSTLPKKGIVAITYEPKNVRYNPNAVGGNRTGWQYRCGDDHFDWYDECTHLRCMGMGKFEQSDFAKLFDALFTAIRAAPGTEQADLKEVFDMCQHCGYGHPAACGEAQFAELRSGFIMSILKQCKYANKCNSSNCSMYHDTAEKNKIASRLDEYVKSVQEKIGRETKWGANDSALALSSTEENLMAKTSSFPALTTTGNWKSPVLPPKLISAPQTASAAAPVQVVVKSQVEDDNLGIDAVHKKYIADLRARSLREKAKKADHAKEIVRMNKEIEKARAEMARLDADAEKVDMLIAVMSSVNVSLNAINSADTDAMAKRASAPAVKAVEVTIVESSSVKAAPKASELSSKAVELAAEASKMTTEVVAKSSVSNKKTASSKKKAISSLSSPASSQIAPPTSLPVLADNDPVVDVSLSEEVDPLSAPLVILQPVNA